MADKVQNPDIPDYDFDDEDDELDENVVMPSITHISDKLLQNGVTVDQLVFAILIHHNEYLSSTYSLDPSLNPTYHLHYETKEMVDEKITQIIKDHSADILNASNDLIE